MSTLTPEVLWAQRANLVYVTVSLPDTTPTINLTEDKLEVSATSDGKNYAVTIEFNKPIDPEASTTNANPRNIFFTLIKKEQDDWWPRLNKGSKKLNFVKTDFARWKDEDDEDDEPEANQPMDMGGMPGMGMGGMPGMGMGGMGGMGGMDGMDLQSLMAQMGQKGQGGMPDMGDYEDDQENDSGDEAGDDVPALEPTAEEK